MRAAPAGGEGWRRGEQFFRRTLLLTSILLLATEIGFTDRAILDPDLGWHLGTAEWIRQEGHVPVTDPFSRDGTDHPWVAYSWLFELTLGGFEQSFGLPGVILLTLIGVLAILGSLWILLRHSGDQPAGLVALMATGMIALSPLLRTPRPWLFTILFFTIELLLIQRARRDATVRGLGWLPPLFLLWANLHIQFIYGLYLLALLWLEGAVQTLRGAVAPLPLRQTTAVMLLSLLATLLTPYGIELYRCLIDLIVQMGGYDLVTEMQALAFRHVADWFVLLISVGAVYRLGCLPRNDFLMRALVVTGFLVAFRSRRDVWFLVIPSLVILAETLPTSAADVSRRLFTPLQSLAALLVTLAFLTQHDRWRYLNQEHLESVLAEVYPRAAVDLVRAKQLPGPLFNTYEWGGYLIWQMAGWPVSIDGRANLHGDDRIRRSRNTWGGAPLWAEDPELNASRLVLAPIDKPLTSLLRLDPRYQMVHEDGIAALFVPRPPRSR